LARKKSGRITRGVRESKTINSALNQENSGQNTIEESAEKPKLSIRKGESGREKNKCRGQPVRVWGSIVIFLRKKVWKERRVLPLRDTIQRRRRLISTEV